MESLGQLITESGYFPRGIFVECVRVVNNVTVKMRLWEKSNGETLSCGTAAVAAAVAAIKYFSAAFNAFSLGLVVAALSR